MVDGMMYSLAGVGIGRIGRGRGDVTGELITGEQDGGK